MITENDIEELTGPVNPALSARIQRNINDAIERNKGTVLNRKIKLLIVAAKKDVKVGAVKEKPAFGEPAGDQGIDLGGMFATGTKKAKSFAAASENNTDDDASEDVEVQESAQDEASADVPDDYMSGLDILDDLTKSGIT